MELLVPSKYGYSFAKEIRRMFIEKVKNQFNYKKTISICLAMIREFDLDDSILASDVFNFMFENIEIINSKDKYIIRINPVVRMEDTSIKLITLVKFITYGNLTQRGYPLVKDVINDIRKEIDDITGGE